MYFLQNNVDIVKGKKNHCIYDLNNQKLYHMTPDYLDQLMKIVDSKDALEVVPKDTLEYLLNSGIIAEEKDLIEKNISYEYSNNIKFAWIEITQNCNLLCRHCYEESSRVKNLPEMSLDDFDYAVKELKNIGVKRIQLVGGEPLIHSRIKEVLKLAYDNFEFIEIFTNGTLLTDELLNYISHCGMSLAFSLYADEASIHDRVTRTEGSYVMTKKNIDKATSKNIPVRVASVEMADIPRFKLSNSDITHRTDFPRLTGRAGLFLYSTEMLKRKLITKQTFTKPLNSELYYKSRIVHNCFGEKIYIDYKLNVFPCVMERRISYGNIYVNPISKIIDNDLRIMNKDRIEGCKECEFRYACYDCRPDSNNQPISSKPWYCTYDYERGIWCDEDDFIKQLFSG